MTAPAAPPTRVPVVSFWLIPPQPARSIATEKPAHIPTARRRIVFAVWNMMPLCVANASPGTPNPNRSQGAACIFCAVEDNGGSFRSLRHAHGVNSQTNAPLGWQRPGARLHHPKRSSPWSAKPQSSTLQTSRSRRTGGADTLPRCREEPARRSEPARSGAPWWCRSPGSGRGPTTCTMRKKSSSWCWMGKARCDTTTRSSRYAPATWS